MDKKVTPIKDYDKICFKCLKEKDELKKYYLNRYEYGSKFDNMVTYLQICNECSPEGIEEWFNEKPEMKHDCYAVYKYEQNIIDFIDTLPIQGQELFWNRCASGAIAYYMDSQDWIDMKLGILPDEKYEAYYMISPRQIKAYEERFTTCEHPVNVYSNIGEGFEYCMCPFGAKGEYGQKASSDASIECFNCEHYKKRENNIKEMDYKAYREYKNYINAKLIVEKFKSLFE